MVFSTTVRIILVSGGIALVALFAVLEAVTGFDAGPYLELVGTAGGGILAGLGLAAGRGTAGAASALLLFVAIGASGCCDTIQQQPIINAYHAGVDAAVEQVGEQDDVGWRTATASARGVGQALDTWRAACRIHEGDGGWQEILGLALETAMGLANIITGAGDGPSDTSAQVPGELQAFIDLASEEIRE